MMESGMEKEIQLQIEMYKRYRTLVRMSDSEKKRYTSREKQKNVLDRNYKKILFGEKDVKKWEKTITEIRFSDAIPAKSVIKASGTNIYGDISEKKDHSVIGWVEYINNGTGYILHIDGEENIYAPVYCSNLFSEFGQVEKIEFGDVFDTSQTTHMGWMFWGCKKLKILDISQFHTENVTNMTSMFFGCQNLEVLDVSGFHTGKVTGMKNMFYYCQKLSTLDVSNFDTRNVTDMSCMFEECINLQSLNVSGFHTENVTDMEKMFKNCRNLSTLDVSGFCTKNVTNMKWMFWYCTNLKVLDLSGFDMQKVTDSTGMLDGCVSLKTTSVEALLK